jgi:hypothetical protein
MYLLISQSSLITANDIAKNTTNIHKIFLAHVALDSFNAINNDNIGDTKNNINGKY